MAYIQRSIGTKGPNSTVLGGGGPFAVGRPDGRRQSPLQYEPKFIDYRYNRILIISTNEPNITLWSKVSWV